MNIRKKGNQTLKRKNLPCLLLTNHSQEQLYPISRDLEMFLARVDFVVWGERLDLELVKLTHTIQTPAISNMCQGSDDRNEPVLIPEVTSISDDETEEEVSCPSPTSYQPVDHPSWQLTPASIIDIYDGSSDPDEIIYTMDRNDSDVDSLTDLTQVDDAGYDDYYCEEDESQSDHGKDTDDEY